MCLHSHRKQYNQRMGEKVSIFSNLYASHDCIPYDPITIVSAIQFIEILDRQTWDIGRGARLIRYEGLKAVKSIQLQSEPWCLLLPVFPYRSRLWWWWWWVSMLLPLVHVIWCLMPLRLDITVDLDHRREGGPHLLAQELCTQSVEGAEYWIHDCRLSLEIRKGRESCRGRAWLLGFLGCVVWMSEIDLRNFGARKGLYIEGKESCRELR